MAGKSYHHGDLRTALLDAADALLEETGLPGFTLRACARRAGVSHAAPKHHFGDSRGLLTAVAARGFERLKASLGDHLGQAAGDLDAEFLATARGYSAFANEYSEHFRIMFRSDLLNLQDPDLHQKMLATFAVLTNVILRQRGEPEIDVGPGPLNDQAEDLLADILIGWSFVHGFAHLETEQQLSMPPDEVRSRVLANVARRLAATVRLPQEGTNR